MLQIFNSTNNFKVSSKLKEVLKEWIGPCSFQSVNLNRQKMQIILHILLRDLIFRENLKFLEGLAISTHFDVRL